MLERDFNGLGSNHDVLGFVRKNSTANHWSRFNVLTGSASNAKQPHIIFDMLNTSFLVTYWDSTTGKLPLTYAGINFNPNTYSWPNLIEQYNDATINMEDVKPHISLNPTNGRTNFVWISGGINVEGVAYFDSNTSLVGVEEEIDEQQLFCFPNPANGLTTVNFRLAQAKKLSLELKDLSGRVVYRMANAQFTAGQNRISLPTEFLDEGCYLITLSSEQLFISNKLIISHH